MRTFTPGLRFWVPVEVIDAHDRNHIVLATCDKQFTLSAAALEEAGDFGDAAEAMAPAAVVGAPLTPTEHTTPLVAAAFIQTPLMNVSDDGLVWTLDFSVKDPSGAEAPLVYRDVVTFHGPPSVEVGDDTGQAMQRRAKEWVRAHGLTVDAPGTPPVVIDEQGPAPGPGSSVQAP